jgi:hypothetical protein
MQMLGPSALKLLRLMTLPTTINKHVILPTNVIIVIIIITGKVIVT